MKKYLCKMLIILWCCLRISPPLLYAQQEFHIIPEIEEGDRKELNTIVQDIWKDAGKVRENYNKQAAKLPLEKQIATGIMDRNTILKYVAYVVSFASQIGLLIGAAMIVYAGYLYATNVFTGKGTSDGNTAIKNAIIGVLVVTFSYAIMKFFTAMFLWT